jgi:trans-aconitate 2-methyltransferase
MLRKARERLPDCLFVKADIGSWTPEPGTDLLFGNAVFQWVPDHPAVLRRLLESLPAGGVLAVQMPDNTREPANALQEKVAANGPWAKDLGAAVPRSGLLAPDAYYDLLRPVCAQIDIWHTIYNFVMETPQAIVEWFKGSSLQPYLALLDTAAREEFLAAYSKRVSAAYEPRVDGTVLLKFPRLFIVATR